MFLICGPAGRAASFFAEARFVPPLRGGGGSSLSFRFAPRLPGTSFAPLAQSTVPAACRPPRGVLFACAKRSKSTLKELRSLRILLHDGGDCFLRFHCGPSGLKRAAPIDRAKRLPNNVVSRPCRMTRGSSRGAVSVCPAVHGCVKILHFSPQLLTCRFGYSILCG